MGLKCSLTLNTQQLKLLLHVLGSLSISRACRRVHLIVVSMRGDALLTGDRDAALQLAAKGKEHAQLAKEARQAANQAAFESFNLHVTNRFKARLFT